MLNTLGWQRAVLDKLEQQNGWMVFIINGHKADDSKRSNSKQRSGTKGTKVSSKNFLQVLAAFPATHSVMLVDRSTVVEETFGVRSQMVDALLGFLRYHEVPLDKVVFVVDFHGTVPPANLGSGSFHPVFTTSNGTLKKLALKCFEQGF